MNILFNDQPTLPMSDWLELNNCPWFKRGHENPNNIDVIYTHQTEFNPKNYPRLKYVICPMTGINHLPLKYLIDTKIINLDNKKWLYDEVWSTAEHTFSIILRLMRGLNRELRGQTVGIIGLGRVGQQLYKLLSSWDVNIIWYDTRTYLYEMKDAPGKVSYIEDIFKKSKVISIHLTETALTKNIINHRLFDVAEHQPVIVNTSRRSIINHKDLLEALEKGKISGFGLDVDLEDTHTDNEILNISKVYKGAIYTPHIAGKSIESRIKTDKYVWNIFFRLLGGLTYDKIDTGLL